MRALAPAVAVLLLAGCATSTTTTAPTVGVSTGVSTSSSLRPSAPPSRTASARPSRTATARPTSGLRTCDLADLPEQARETASAVAAGGPFRYPRNDGVTYYNRNAVLPRHATGTYREFTVRTPNAPTRGTRRLVTDGNPTTGAPTRTPSAWYYTDDHYTTFCQVTGTP